MSHGLGDSSLESIGHPVIWPHSLCEKKFIQVGSQRDDIIHRADRARIDLKFSPSSDARKITAGLGKRLTRDWADIQDSGIRHGGLGGLIRRQISENTGDLVKAKCQTSSPL